MEEVYIVRLRQQCGESGEHSTEPPEVPMGEVGEQREDHCPDDRHPPEVVWVEVKDKSMTHAVGLNGRSDRKK